MFRSRRPDHPSKVQGATAVIIAVVAIALMLTVSGTSSSAAASTSHDRTYTIGVLADLSGPGASVNGSTNLGVRAGIQRAKREGYTIKEKVVDTGTSSTQVLS